MKKSILLPLLVGLLFAGCNRTNTDSDKISRNDQPAANKPTTDQPAAAARQDATRQAQATSPTANPDSTAAATRTAPTTPDSYTVASKPSVIAPPPTVKIDTQNKPDISARLAEWKLTSDEIKSEVEKGGRIERSRTARADEPTGPMDSIVVAAVNRRLKADSETSELKLDVKADKGAVTLDGSAQSLDQIGRAIAIALDTDGVTKAVSTMKLVKPE